MSESVPIKRWKKYGLILVFAFFAWATMYGMVGLDAKKVAGAGTFALVTTAAACWRDRRRADDQRQTS